MKSVISSEEKIQQLCDVLQKEAVEPAKQEAKKIIDEAKQEASRIISQAQTQAQDLLSRTKEEIHREKSIAQSALTQGARQALGLLRNEIEERLFNQKLKAIVANHLNCDEILAQSIHALLEAIKKEGLEGDIQVLVHKNIDLKKLSQALYSLAGEHLKEGVLIARGEHGGVKVRLLDEHITVEMTDERLTELLCQYLRADFRKNFFGEPVAV